MGVFLYIVLFCISNVIGSTTYIVFITLPWRNHVGQRWMDHNQDLSVVTSWNQCYVVSNDVTTDFVATTIPCCLS